jgi:hypothetical protein
MNLKSKSVRKIVVVVYDMTCKVPNKLHIIIILLF